MIRRTTEQTTSTRQPDQQAKSQANAQKKAQAQQAKAQKTPANTVGEATQKAMASLRESQQRKESVSAPVKREEPKAAEPARKADPTRTTDRPSKSLSTFNERPGQLEKVTDYDKFDDKNGIQVNTESEAYRNSGIYKDKQTTELMRDSLSDDDRQNVNARWYGIIDGDGKKVDEQKYAMAIDSLNNDFNAINSEYEALNESYRNGSMSYQDYEARFNELVERQDSLKAQADEMDKYQVLEGYDYYDYMVKSGDEENARKFERYMGAYDDTWIERLGKIWGASVIDLMNEIPQVASVVDQINGGEGFRKEGSVANNLSEQANEIREYAMGGASPVGGYTLNAIGSLLPMINSIALSAIIPGLGAYTEAVTLGNMAVQSFGSTYQEDTLKGWDDNAAMSHSLLTAGATVLAEKIGGERFINLMSGEGGALMLGALFQKAPKQIIGELVKAGASEGLEEVMEDWMDYGINLAIKGANPDVDVDIDAPTMQQMGEEFALAFTGSMLLGAVPTTLQVIQNSEQYSQAKQLHDYYMSVYNSTSDMALKNAAGMMALNLEDSIQGYDESSPIHQAIKFEDGFDKISSYRDTMTQYMEAMQGASVEKVGEYMQLQQANQQAQRLMGTALAQRGVVIQDSSSESSSRADMARTVEVFNSLPKAQQRALTTVGEFAKNQGIKVKFDVNMEFNRNGKFDGDTITINPLSIDSIKDGTISVLSHEVVHSTEGTAEWRTLRDSVKAELGEKEFQKRLEDKKALYERNNQTLTDEGAAKEVVAFRLQEMLQDEKGMKELASYSSTTLSRIIQDLKAMGKSNASSQVMESFKKAYRAAKAEQARGSQFSISDDINSAMTMKDAKEMVQRAYNINGIQEWTDGIYKNADEWLKDVGSNEVAMYIDNTYELQDKYINRNEAILNDEYTIEDVLDAYLEGTLVGKSARKSDSAKLNLKNESGTVDNRFYAPREVEATREMYDLANTRITKANREDVNKARADIMIASHTQDVAGMLGIDQKELSKKLKQWGSYNSNVMNMSKSLNEGVSLENQWTGLENSSIINSITVSNEQMEKLVKEVKGDSSGWQRGYITNTMLAIDGHTDFSLLTFEFDKARELREKHALGDYNPNTDTIRIGNGYQNTVAHEIGHYIDNLWGRELGYKGNLTDLSTSYKAYKDMNAEQKAFVDHFNLFMDSIDDVADNRNRYTLTRTEILARFIGKFTEWTRNQATNGRYQYESKMYTDAFTTSHYMDFVKLLQEKSYLDTTGQTTKAATRESNKDVQYSIAENFVGEKKNSELLLPYSQKEIDITHKNGDYVLGIDYSIKDFFNKFSKSNDDVNLWLGKIDDSLINTIKKELGIDLTGRSLSISSSSLNHIENRHGINNYIKQGNPMPISVDDMDYLAALINNFDEAYYYKKKGQNRISFIVNVDGANYSYALFELVPTKNKDIRVVTMYTFNSNQKADIINTIKKEGLQVASARQNVSANPTSTNNGNGLNYASNQSIPNNSNKSTGVQHSISEVDTEGKALPEKVREYFKDSKVVDENGNLKVMYHGTESGGFTRFNNGFTFLTDRQSTAEGYSGYNEIYDPNAKYTLDELRDIFNGDVTGEDWDISYEDGKIKAYNDTEETTHYFADENEMRDYLIDNYLSNGRSPVIYKTYVNITNPFVVDADGAWWADIPAPEGMEGHYGEESGLENVVTTNEIAEWAKEHGYDGVIINNVVDGTLYQSSAEAHMPQNEAIAFSPEQIKNVNNENPTSSKDIRYSISDDASYDQEFFDDQSRRWANREMKSLAQKQSKADFENLIESINNEYDQFDQKTQEDLDALLNELDSGIKQDNAKLKERTEFLAEVNRQLNPNVEEDGELTITDNEFERMISRAGITPRTASNMQKVRNIMTENVDKWVPNADVIKTKYGGSFNERTLNNAIFEAFVWGDVREDTKADMRDQLIAQDVEGVLQGRNIEDQIDSAFERMLEDFMADTLYKMNPSFYNKVGSRIVKTMDAFDHIPLDEEQIKSIKKAVMGMEANQEFKKELKEDFKDTAQFMSESCKDLSKFGYFGTLEQNLLKMSGYNQEVYARLNADIVRPRENARAQMVALKSWAQSQLNEIQKTGITKNTKESQAVQWIMEGHTEKLRTDLQTEGETTQETLDEFEKNPWEKYTAEDLKRDFSYRMPNGRMAYENIMDAAKILQDSYADMIDKVNTSQMTINGSEDAIKGELKAQLNDLKIKSDNALENIRMLRSQMAEQGSTPELEAALKKVTRAYNSSIRKYNQLAEGIENNDAFRRQLTPIRSNYAPHFKESTFKDAFKALGKDSKVPTELTGISSRSRPNTGFASFMMEQGKGEYNADAIKGFERYMDMASKLVAYNPVVVQYRALANDLRQQNLGTTNMSRFTAWLDEYTNTLAGKRTNFNRSTDEQLGAVMKPAKALTRMGAAAALKFNVRSALVQFGNIPNGLGLLASQDTKWKSHVYQGLGMWASDMKNGSKLIDQSPFMSSRFFDYDDGDHSFKQKMNNVADFMMTKGDQIAAQMIWYSAYAQSGSNVMGMEPIEYADYITRSAIAGRDHGDIPIAMQQDIVKFLVPFQIEVNNQWQTMSRLVNTKHAGALATIFIASFVMNQLFRAVGLPDDPLTDPVTPIFNELTGKDSVWEMLSDISNGEQMGGLVGGEKDINEFMTNVMLGEIGEAMSAMPGGSYIGQSLGENFNDAIGDYSPSRYGSGTFGVTGLGDIFGKAAEGDLVGMGEEIASNYLPGGTQAVRTMKGLQSMGALPKMVGKGDKARWDMSPTNYTSSGKNISFVNDQSNVFDWMRAAAFGKWATKPAQDYISSGFKSASPTASNVFQAMASVDGSTPKVDLFNEAKDYGRASNESSDSLAESLKERDVFDEYIDQMNQAYEESDKSKSYYQFANGYGLTKKTLNENGYSYSESSNVENQAIFEAYKWNDKQKEDYQKAIDIEPIYNKDGSRVRNSEQLATRKALEESGMYDQVVEYIRKNNLDPFDFGLGVQVMSYDSEKFMEEYRKVYGRTDYGRKKARKSSGSSKSSSKSKDIKRIRGEISKLLEDIKDRGISSSESSSFETASQRRKKLGSLKRFE